LWLVVVLEVVQKLGLLVEVVLVDIYLILVMIHQLVMKHRQ
jgi:hypothetical protein